MKQFLEMMGVWIAPLCCLGRVFAMSVFCKKYLKISGGKEALFVMLLFGNYTVLGYIVGRCAAVPYIVLAVWNHIFVLVLVFFLFQADAAKKVIAAAMLAVLTTLTGSFLDSFLSVAALFWLHAVKGISNPLPGGVWTVFADCAGTAIEIAVLCRMPKCLNFFGQSRTGRWQAVLAIPLFVIAAVVDVANWGASNGILVRGEEGMGLYYDQVFSHAGICVLSALSILAAGFYVFGLERVYLEQRKSSRYEAQIAAYRMLEEQYGRSERLRHDMKNHILALSALLKNQEWEKMGQYLKDMRDGASLTGCEKDTGNAAVNALLWQKQSVAQSQGIVWECDVQMPGRCGVDDFDLCVLFGNLLDNALEACGKLSGERHRFIDIQAKSVKKCFLLEVKNSADDKGGSAAKALRTGHGIGLLNVRDMVSRYDGVLHIESGGGVFSVTVLIPPGEAGCDM